MAGFRDSRKYRWLCFRVCMAVIPLIVLYNKAIKHNNRKQVEKREILTSTEIPAGHMDSSSLDLTVLVNTLINFTHTGSQHYFSLLSVTSHSLLALNKVTVLVYNISNFRNVESNVFPTRYCYCLTNRSNDLTEFTAILLDVMGNSTSYLHELFKSSSILSVSQHNDSDCIYICVMAGRSDGDLSQLWEMESAKPLFNQTVMAEVHKGNTSIPPLPVEWHHLPTRSSLVSLSKPSETWSNAAYPSLTEAVTTPGPALHTHGPTHAHAPVTEKLQKDTGCPWRKPDLAHAGPWTVEHIPTSTGTSTGTSKGTSTGTSSTTTPHKLHPCLLDLCKFFSQCLCRGYSQPGMGRFCMENHSWYMKNTVQVCRKLKRISFSKSLKQKCLARMCSKP